MKAGQTRFLPLFFAFWFGVFSNETAQASSSRLFDISDACMTGLNYSANDVTSAVAVSEPGQTESRPRFVKYNVLHKYLGYGTLLMAGLAASTGSDKNSHCIPGYATAGMATLTCMTGFMEYGGEYFDFSEGFNAYNMHILLGALATGGFIATVALADSDEEHAGLGGVSAIGMVIPIAIIQW